MAALASGIFSHASAAAQSLAGLGAAPMSASGSASPMDAAGASSTSSTSANISANDFLTLLVTEMQNQDPTATTDPNEYINQLVNVNSLEQLIDINQNLSSALGISPGSASSASAAQASPAASASVAGPSGAPSASSSSVRLAPGNLTAPDVLPAAQNLAHSLDGRPRAQSDGFRLHAAR